MAEHEHPLQTPKIRLWHYLPLLVILGLAVHLLLPQITTLENSWSVVRKMLWWAMALGAWLKELVILHTHSTTLSRISPKRQLLIRRAEESPKSG